MRYRFVFMAITLTLGFGLLVLSTPGLNIIQMDVGADTLSKLMRLFFGLMSVGIFHISRKALFDYIDVSALLAQAIKEPTGAGLAFLGFGVWMLGVSVMFAVLVSLF